MAKSPKRERPSWDESFMMSCLLAAARSSCIHLQTGAAIVRDKRVIATGYNGAPPNIENCLARGCRKDEKGIDFHDKGKSICRGTHAEMNAMGQIARHELIGVSIYTLYFPCSACAKEIAGKSLSEVVYCRPYQGEDDLTREIFAEAGISLRQLKFDTEKYLAILRRVAPEHQK